MAFGFGAPRNIIDPRRIEAGGDGARPRAGDLSTQERLLMVGAILQGDSETASRIPLLAEQRRKKAEEQAWRGEFAQSLEGVPMKVKAPVTNQGGEDISAAFSPQEQTVRGPRPTLRDLVPKLVEGMGRGYNVDPLVNLLDKTGPSIKYHNDLRYDERDPSSAPKEIPKIGEGQRRLFDADGKIIGVMNADGYVQSIADVERAKTRASEQEKARYDLTEIESDDGSKSKVPRLGVVEGFQGVPMKGQPPAGGAGPAPGFNRSQTPADRVRAEGRAKTEVEVEALTPKAKSSLDTLNRKTDFVLDTLRKARGQATGGIGGAAGLNSLLAGVPETAAYDLRSTLDTIEAAIGFDELQTMRDNSPTGGAVGNLTERELSLLSSLRGSLKAGQSPEQLRQNIDGVIGELEKITKERRGAFDRQYGSARAAPSGGGGRTYTPEDRARAAEILRQRRAAKAGQ
jgi:hypothetical protein